MTMQVRMWLTALAFVAVLGLTATASAFVQGDSKEIAAVKKVADVFKKGKAEDTKKAAAEAAKMFDEISELMALFRPRNKHGMGWGATAGKNPATDGLEKKIQEFTKAVPPTAVADVENNVAAASWMGALAEIMIAKAPKDAGAGKTKKAWVGYAEDMRAASADFAKAAAAKKGPDMSKAASKINAACNNCHSKFKE
jgi:hypothetical protein